jgi:hypothetical protein
MLEAVLLPTERSIKNGQCRNTGNNGYKTHRTKKNKTQKNNKQKTKVEHDESHQTEGKIIVKINLYCTNVKNLQNYSFQIKNLN